MPILINAHEKFAQSNRAERLEILFAIQIECDNGRSFDAVVTNLSARGFGARTRHYLEPYQHVYMIKPRYGRIRGEIRWVEGENFGALFNEAVNINLLKSI